MAHLARCWCGREYRCETDCIPSPGVTRCYSDDCHDPCPDFIFHGRWIMTRYAEVKFREDYYGTVIVKESLDG